MPRTRVYHAQKPSFWQRQHANLACCREPNLIFALLTAQRIFAIITRRTKPPAAISQDFLLGGSRAGHPHPIYYGCGRFRPIRSVLIYAMCLFEDGIGVARRRPVARASLRSRQSSYVIPRSETTWESHK